MFSVCVQWLNSLSLLPKSAQNFPQPQPAATTPRQAKLATPRGTTLGLWSILYLVTKHNEFLRLETRNKNPEHKELPIILTQLGFFNPIHSNHP
jgi:hypothetical protein